MNYEIKEKRIFGSFINGYLPFIIRQYSIICGWKNSGGV